MNNFINFSGLGIELGQSKRGFNSSPQFARNYFSILKNSGIEISDFGDINSYKTTPSEKIFSVLDIKNFQWDIYKQAQDKTRFLLGFNTPLINWGGDHSVALSTVSAFSSKHANGYVLWIDAHADLNLPNQSLTGNFHGMPLAVLCNLENISTYYFQWLISNIEPQKIIYLGLRDLDPFEIDTIKRLGILYYTSEDVRLKGMDTISEEIVSLIGRSPLHISFDIDSVDPGHAFSTGVPVPMGLNPEDLEILGRKCFKNTAIKSVDVVEINPQIGSVLQVDQTYITAFYFLRSLLTHTDQGDMHDSISKKFQTTNINEMEWGL